MGMSRPHIICLLWLLCLGCTSYSLGSSLADAGYVQTPDGGSDVEVSEEGPPSPNGGEDAAVRPPVAAAGKSHTCALVGGALQCWGDNRDGRLGVSMATPTTTPKGVASMAADVQGVATGDVICAIKGGSAWCWGDNTFGAVGDGTNKLASTPQRVLGFNSKVDLITVGGGHACALTDLGAVKCWGNGLRGQLGQGDITVTSTPVAPVGSFGRYREISAGGQHTCGITVSGLVCWGDNARGQLGRAPGAGLSYQLVPGQVTSVTGNVTSIACGGEHTCAIVDGKLQCWGAGGSGQLGTGMIEQSSLPNVVGLPGPVTAVATGTAHTCAVAKGALYCWGLGEFGRLGVMVSPYLKSPALVPGFDRDVTAVSAGSTHTCAVQAGKVKCWGANSAGQVGNGTTSMESSPTEVMGL